MVRGQDPLNSPYVSRTSWRGLTLPRRIFFANQGEFTTGDYGEIINKASCLSLVSNAILYWNTLQITDIVDKLRAQGEAVDPATLSHISLLPFKHVVPNGTYFIEDMEQG
jgi:hypothetical protein